MKTMKLFIAIFLATAIGAYTSAQTSPKSVKQKTETIKVLGNCGMCKTRIEQSVLDEGATKAEWSAETKLLTVIYDPAKTSTDKLEAKLAMVGHDTKNHKADNKVYEALPGCCKYERVMASYSCPMHTEITSDKPGKCSKCSMALVKEDIAKPAKHSMEHKH
jgi:periplasmic mercuric ion binding protein